MPVVVGSCHDRVFPICRKGLSVILQNSNVLLGLKVLPPWKLGWCSFSTYTKPGRPSHQVQLHPLLSHPLSVPTFHVEGPTQDAQGQFMKGSQNKFYSLRPPFTMHPVRLMLLEEGKAWSLAMWRQNPWFSTWVYVVLCSLLKSFSPPHLF